MLLWFWISSFIALLLLKNHITVLYYVLNHISWIFSWYPINYATWSCLIAKQDEIAVCWHNKNRVPSNVISYLQVWASPSCSLPTLRLGWGNHWPLAGLMCLHLSDMVQLSSESWLADTSRTNKRSVLWRLVAGASRSVNGQVWKGLNSAIIFMEPQRPLFVWWGCS